MVVVTRCEDPVKFAFEMDGRLCLNFQGEKAPYVYVRPLCVCKALTHKVPSPLRQKLYRDRGAWIGPIPAPSTPMCRAYWVCQESESALTSLLGSLKFFVLWFWETSPGKEYALSRKDAFHHSHANLVPSVSFTCEFSPKFDLKNRILIYTCEK